MKYDLYEEFPEFKENEKDEYFIITPVLRLEINEKITTGKYTLYPSGTLDFNSLTKGNISDKIEANRLTFNSNPLLVFQQRIDISTPFSQIHDEQFISEAFHESEKFLNLIKFFYCKYFDSSTLIGNSGQREDGKNVIFVVHKTGIPFTRIKEDYFLTHKITKGVGLKITDFSPIKNLSFFEKEFNEVGNILLHALELNSAILNSNTNTQKFILMMNLIEYLGYPNSYEQFKKVKSKIIYHNTDNLVEYHELSERFKELTGGTVNKSGQKILGFRTQILHIGKKIEQIVADKDDLTNLFRELQGYIYRTMIDMFKFSNKSWQDLEKFRSDKWESIQKNKITKEKRDVHSDKLILIDLDFLDKESRRWVDFYKNLYPEKNIDKIFIEHLIIQTCIQSSIKTGNDILTVALIANNNSNYCFAEKVIKLKETDFLSFDMPDTYKFDVKIFRVDTNQQKYDHITAFLDMASKEGNTFTDKIAGKTNSFFICIDDEAYFSFFDEFRQRKKLRLLKLNSWETELPLKNVLWTDIAHVIGLSLGLEIFEL